MKTIDEIAKQLYEALLPYNTYKMKTSKSARAVNAYEKYLKDKWNDSARRAEAGMNDVEGEKRNKKTKIK